MNYPIVNGLHLPFLDFFKDFSENDSLYNFGGNSREEALKYVKSFNHVIDIGAHVGISVIHWSKLFSKVTAFEPMIDHYNCLIKNTENLKNIECHNNAISGSEGILYGAYRSNKNSGSFQLLDSNYQQPKKKSPRQLYEILVKKLDSFEFKSVDLIKVDVEGWELDVLKGATLTIQKHKPVLLIEFTGGNSSKSLHGYDVNEYLELIDNLGYQKVSSIESDTIYVSK